MRLRLSQSAGYLFEQFRIGDLIGRSMVKARTGHLKILGHHPRGDAFAKGIPRQAENRNPREQGVSRRGKLLRVRHHHAALDQCRN